MSRRNRMFVTAIGLVTALSLTAPAPSHALGLRDGGLSLADTLDLVWSWVTGHPQKPTSPQRQPRPKEGGMINPNGGNSLLQSPWVPDDNLDEGGMINPNGNH